MEIVLLADRSFEGAMFSADVSAPFVEDFSAMEMMSVLVVTSSASLIPPRNAELNVQAYTSPLHQFGEGGFLYKKNPIL